MYILYHKTRENTTQFLQKTHFQCIFIAPYIHIAEVRGFTAKMITEKQGVCPAFCFLELVGCKKRINHLECYFCDTVY